MAKNPNTRGVIVTPGDAVIVPSAGDLQRPTRGAGQAFVVRGSIFPAPGTGSERGPLMDTALRVPEQRRR